MLVSVECPVHLHPAVCYGFGGSRDRIYFADTSRRKDWEIADETNNIKVRPTDNEIRLYINDKFI